MCLAIDLLEDILHGPPHDFSEEGSVDVNILILEIKIQGESQKLRDVHK